MLGTAVVLAGAIARAAVDVFKNHKLLGEYFDGSKSLPEDLKAVLSRPAVSADGVQKLTVSALLGDLMLSSDGAVKRKLQALLQKAQELGLE